MQPDARYTTAVLPAYLLRYLAGMSPDFGIDPARLCRGLGFEIADLSAPGCRLSFRQASEMIRRTVQGAPGQPIGLEIANNETISSIGLVGYAMLTSPTVGTAIEIGIRMQNYAGSMLRLTCVKDGSTSAITATSHYHEPDIEVFLIEEAFGSFMSIARALVAEPLRPSWLEFSYGRPSYVSAYERTFGCPMRFDQLDNVFFFDTSWIGKKIPTYDPLSHRQVLELLDSELVRETEDTDLIESVLRIVRRDLRQALSCEFVATQLCMSERTLRRKLSQTGVSYQMLLDSARARRAVSLLQNSRLSVEEVSYEVGFSDSHNFRRAFKRWTGHSPRPAARERLLSETAAT